MPSKPARIMYREGGGWYTWERHIAGRSPGSAIGHYNKGDNDRFRAVEFEDGSVFDAIEGWKEAK